MPSGPAGTPHGRMTPSRMEIRASPSGKVPVRLEANSEAVAGRTRTVWRVERELPGLELGNADTALGTGVVLAEQVSLRRGIRWTLHLARAPAPPPCQRPCGAPSRRTRRSGPVRSPSEPAGPPPPRCRGSGGGSAAEAPTGRSGSPSTRARTNPSCRASSNRSRNSPFRPRIRGARISIFVASGHVAIRVAIWVADCRRTGCRTPDSGASRPGPTEVAGSRRSP